MMADDNPFNIKAYSIEGLTAVISSNYLPDRINGPEKSRLIFIAGKNELLRRLNEDRSWEQLSVEFEKWEPISGVQLSLF